MEKRTTAIKPSNRAELNAIAEVLRHERPSMGDYGNPFPLGQGTHEGESFQITGYIEVCGPSLRLFLYEGSFLRFTTRVAKVSVLWMACDPHTQVEVLKIDDEGYRSISYKPLGQARRAAPEAWVTYLYETMYAPVTVRRSRYMKAVR